MFYDKAELIEKYSCFLLNKCTKILALIDVKKLLNIICTYIKMSLKSNFNFENKSRYK